MAGQTSSHTRLPKERITLEECQALIESKTLPVRVSARFAIIASGVALLVSLLAFVVSVIR